MTFATDLLIGVGAGILLKAFTNLLGLRKALAHIPEGVCEVVVDFSASRLVDHSTLERVLSIADEWPSARLTLAGLDKHKKSSTHRTAVHVRGTEAAAA